MTNIWITNASPTIQAVVDPVAAACEDGFVPDELHLLEHPEIDQEGDRAAEIIQEIVATYGTTLGTQTVMLDDEREIDRIAKFYREAITADDSVTVAVDVTPGRKFVSVLAFQAAIQFGADHIFYLYIRSSEHYGRPHPQVPTPGAELMDLKEVFHA